MFERPGLATPVGAEDDAAFEFDELRTHRVHVAGEGDEVARREVVAVLGAADFDARLMAVERAEAGGLPQTGLAAVDFHVVAVPLGVYDGRGLPTELYAEGGKDPGRIRYPLSRLGDLRGSNFDREQHSVLRRRVAAKPQRLTFFQRRIAGLRHVRGSGYRHGGAFGGSMYSIAQSGGSNRRCLNSLPFQWPSCSVELKVCDLTSRPSAGLSALMSSGLTSSRSLLRISTASWVDIGYA